MVLTPDKTALRENIQRSGERELALREEPNRKENKITERMRVLITKQRIHQDLEHAHQREFVRQRIRQQQTRGIRI